MSLHIDVAGMVARGIYCVLTVYMMLLLLRWLAVYLQVDLYRPWLRWVRAVTDPLINNLRRVLPVLGPFDFAPIAAILLVFLVRLVLVGV